jgi:biopolymer transport protein ExbB/TolQ/biopolymer transport protein ExbD
MPGVCLNSWQTYGCEWGIGYLWRWMNWIARFDVFALALMLVYIVIVVSRSSYRCHVACRQSRAFMRAAASAFSSGAFDEVLTIAARTRRSPVAAMVTTGITALASVPSQFTLSEAIDAASRAFHRGQRTLAADLSLGVGALRSIASIAPFLGLAGTCFGILSAFRGFGMQKQAALAMMTTYIAASLITTATGLIVAVPAVWSYNYLRVRIDRLESEMSNMALEAITQLNAHPHSRILHEHFAAGSKAIDSGVDAVAGAREVRREDGRTGACSRIASKLPLTKQFSKLPAFALIAAPSLASVLAAFTAFLSVHTSKGLEVRVLELGALEKSDDFSAKPIFIGLVETRMNKQTAVYVNSKKTPWDNLESTVRNELKIRPQSIVYVEAENSVAWADVAKVIDAVEALPADVVLLTIAPEFNSNHTHRSGKSMK